MENWIMLNPLTRWTDWGDEMGSFFGKLDSTELIATLQDDTYNERCQTKYCTALNEEWHEVDAENLLSDVPTDMVVELPPEPELTILDELDSLDTHAYTTPKGKVELEFIELKKRGTE